MSQKIHAGHGVHELSETEVDEVAGGSIMEMIARAWTNVTGDCLVRLTREGTVIDCNYPYRL
jgi:hypothetical protein